MSSLADLYTQVYKKGNLFGVDKMATRNPLVAKDRRANSIAVVGGALGDEGKGRVTDEITSILLKDHQQVIHYRDNGGANAGHTVEVGPVKIALHQIGSGVLQKGCTVILGKEMVLHPEDLVSEIESIKTALNAKTIPAELIIDEMTALCLDTHRAFEEVLKARSTGSAGSTGRGISPAYADVVYRHPLRVRDLFASDWEERLKKHYSLYQQLCAGVGFELKTMHVMRLAGKPVVVGTVKKMIDRLAAAKKQLKKYVQPANEIVAQHWAKGTPFVFEKAQALGLDIRWGLYPDVTASNCGFDGIFSSTEGVIDHRQIAIKAGTIKATYTSSVGARKLPTLMPEKLAHRIREDAWEYGSTTKRPRDIAYLDLPMLRYFFKVGRIEHLVMTHLDISYPEVPIKICVGYTIKGKVVDYRPDQEYLNKVKPEYLELPSWDGAQVQSVTKVKDLPKAAQQYIAFISQALQAKPFMVAVGPKRKQGIRFF